MMYDAQMKGKSSKVRKRKNKKKRVLLVVGKWEALHDQNESKSDGQ